MAALAGCQAPFPTAKLVAAQGGSVVEALYGGFPGPLNPLFEAEDNARDIDSLVYQGLTSVQGDQSVSPLLARSWSISDDRLIPSGSSATTGTPARIASSSSSTPSGHCPAVATPRGFDPWARTLQS